jgi:radical SAM-linked protein
VRVRVRYTKVGKIRFIGHRDVARIWERTLRKAGVSVAYSEGFSPRPKLAFGLALPTGAESYAEFLDIDVATEIGAEEFAERIGAALPPGFSVQAVAMVDKQSPSLQEDVIACTWEFTLPEIGVDDVEQAVASALAADELFLERERKGEKRVDDLRPAIEGLAVRVVDGEAVLLASLATRPRGMRPSELLAVCFPNAANPDEIARRVLRTSQMIERDGARRDLLPLDAAEAPHTDEVCA